MNFMIRITRKTAAAMCVIAFVCLMFMFQAKPVDAASTEGYELNKYDLTAVVHKDHSYSINEKLTVDIPEDFKSFSVEIPAGNYRISDINVTNAAFTTSSDDNTVTVTIKSKSLLKKGRHTFELTYRIEEYAEKNASNDIFYFNALAPSWKIPINSVRIALVLPKDFQWDDLQYYAGQFGTQDSSNKLSVATNANTVVVRGTKLPANYGITFKAQLKNGYWQGALDNNWAAAFAMIVMLFAVVIVFLAWLIGGRDPRIKHKKVVYPIDGMTPVEVGYLFTGKIRAKDMVSILIYLAINGSLRISEYAPKKYRLYKLEEPKEEERYIRGVYHTLFDDVYEGRALEMSEIGPKLLKAKSNVQASVESGYSSKDMRAATKFSRVLRWISSLVLSFCMGIVPLLTQIYQYQEMTYTVPVVVAIVTMVTVFLVCKSYDLKYDMSDMRFRVNFGFSIAFYLAILGYVAVPLGMTTGSTLVPGVIIISGIIALMTICVMKARAVGNAKIVSQLLSLRHFINNASNAEVAVICAHDQDYYYKVLPYAFIFSMMEKWSKKFRWMQIPEPDWFSDDISGHAITNEMRARTTIDYAAEVNTFARTIISEYRAMRSRSRKHT